MVYRMQSKKPNSTRKICIIGGYGAMGQLLMRFLQTLPHYEISLFGEQDWDSPKHKLNNQDIVLISTPIAVTSTVIQKVSTYLNEYTILADLTSIKEEPLNIMLTAHRGPVVGLHPIFGPTINKAAKRVIIYCHGRHHEAYQWFIDDLIHLDFTLKQMSARAHDDAMTFIQGIEHFSVFCMGLFLKKHNIDLIELRSLSSPVYRMELNIIGRLFNQDPHLYANIIVSDNKRLDMIAEYAKLITEQASYLKNDDGKEQFVNHFNEVKNWMGEFSNKAYHESDRLLGIVSPT